MVEVARANERLIMEAFMYRFHPQTLWALGQVYAGRIGTVKLVHVSFAFKVMKSSHPRNIRLQAALAGGSLMDVGCYPVNFCRAVFGHPPLTLLRGSINQMMDMLSWLQMPFSISVMDVLV